MVSKTAVLLTEWVFEIDLVSKMPNLLTEWVSESDLVSKMADLLTEKGVRRERWSHIAWRGAEGLPRFGREQDAKGQKRSEG